MRSILSGIVAIGLCVLSSGCSKSETEHNHAHENEVSAANPAAANPAATTQTVEVGCGSCLYGMDGVKGCQLATKIDGKPYLVSGVDIDTHASGLCAGVKQAELTGRIEDGKFIASRMELKP